MKAIGERQRYTAAGKNLKKLRRRYVRYCKPFIEKDHSLLWPVAKKMLVRGLRAASVSEKDCRYYILREMSKLDGCPRKEMLSFRGFGWHEWLLAKGWGLRFHDAA